MQSNNLLACGLLAASLALAAAPAAAGDDCNVPAERWQSREAVQQMAQRQGWQVERLKIDDGCYEIVGKEASGRPFKAKIDPQSLEVVEMKARDKDRKRGGEPPRDAARAS